MIDLVNQKAMSQVTMTPAIATEPYDEHKDFLEEKYVNQQHDHEEEAESQE